MMNLRRIASASLLSLVASAAAMAAQVNVAYSTFPAGALTGYDFSVTNGLDPSAGELLSVTLTVPADATAVQNLTAPSGFSAFFDAGLGLVDFVEDSMGFTSGSTVGPFSFLSPFQITPSFTGLALDTNENPVAEDVGVVTASPEPAGAGFTLLGLLVFGASYRRFSRKQQVNG